MKLPKLKPRNSIVPVMVATKKSGKMKDRRAPRGGAKNKQKEYLKDI